MNRRLFLNIRTTCNKCLQYSSDKDLMILLQRIFLGLKLCINFHLWHHRLGKEKPDWVAVEVPDADSDLVWNSLPFQLHLQVA
uniref:Uncharacterized protein n=1 Tax=Meloidogyne enterolobii TaxID=390850 RepID=A0A6V7Y166_MELEN|nr:unnamed protein product [Meloidogyne enterolobii]